MINNASTKERRRDDRIECRDSIRWKRPGRFEDHKAWSSDRSPTSLGFITETRHAPAVEVKGATFTELKVHRNEDGAWIAQCVVDV